jgi:hypothetical protein
VFVTILTGWTLERARMILPKFIATSGSEDGLASKRPERAVRLLKGTSNEREVQAGARRSATRCAQVSSRLGEGNKLAPVNPTASSWRPNDLRSIDSSETKASIANTLARATVSVTVRRWPPVCGPQRWRKRG